MSSAGIVVVSKFTTGKSKKFSSYVDYVDRDEAVRSSNFKKFNLNAFDGYQNYMENPEKSSGLFTQHKDSLTKNERKLLKEQFQLAQKNDSVMWQDVISFDNEWLEKHGIYRSKDNLVNEEQLKRSIREGMERVLEKEQMKQSGLWAAAIHYNTENIHVHIALVEPNPTKKYDTFRNKKTGETYTARRGYRAKNTLDELKRKVVSNLVNREHEMSKISGLIYKQMRQKQQEFKKLPDFQLQHLYQKIYKNLPTDRRMWKYNMNALDKVKPYINQFIHVYLETYEKENLKQFDEMLDKEVQFQKETYGEGQKEKGRADNYKVNKYNELYSKLGNTLLKEMLADSYNEHANINGNGQKFNQIPSSSKVNLNKLKHALRKDFKSIKNQMEYQRNLQQQSMLER